MATRRALIEQIYRDHLNSTNDTAGMDWWENSNIADADLQSAIRRQAGLGSPDEYSQPGADFQNRDDYIRTLYETELGREPGQIDPQGLQFWRNSGLTGDALVKAMRGAAGMDNTLYEDPAYNAFMRSYNQRAATVNADKVARTREIRNTRDIAGAGFERRLTEGLGQVDDDAEARGQYQSGSRLDKRSRLAQGIAFERSAAENQYGQQESELNRAASSELSGLSRNRDEEEIAARRRLTAQTIQDNARAQ